MDVQNIDQAPAFTTKDGSEIRELLAYRNSLEGCGEMELAGEVRLVEPGDAIAIPPGVPHQIKNRGAGILKFLCCCTPAYEHEDTVLQEV